jgi:hypothetical protein
MVVPKEEDIGGEFSVLVRLSDDPSARLTYKVLQYFGMDGRDGAMDTVLRTHSLVRTKTNSLYRIKMPISESKGRRRMQKR